MPLTIGGKLVVVASGEDRIVEVMTADKQTIQARVPTAANVQKTQIAHLDAWREVLGHLRKKKLHSSEVVNAFERFMGYVEGEQIKLARDANTVAETIWMLIYPKQFSRAQVYRLNPKHTTKAVFDPKLHNALMQPASASWLLNMTSGTWLEVFQGDGALITPEDGYDGIWTKGLQQCVALVYIYYKESRPLNRANELQVIGVALCHLLSGVIFERHGPWVVGKKIFDKYGVVHVGAVLAQGAGGKNYSISEESIDDLARMMTPGSLLLVADGEWQYPTFGVRIDDGSFGLPGEPKKNVQKKKNSDVEKVEGKSDK